MVNDGRLRRAMIEANERILARDDVDDAVRLKHQVLKWLGLLDADAELLEKAVLHGVSSTFLVSLGTLHSDRGEHAKAVDCYERYLSSARPPAWQALVNLGNARAALAQHDAALGAWYRAVAIAPDQIQPRRALVHGLWAMGRHAEAVAIGQQALTAFGPANDEEGVAFHCLVAELLCECQAGEQALHVVRQVLRTHGNSDAARELEIRALGLSGDLESMRDRLRDYLARHPDDEWATGALAKVVARLKDRPTP